MDQAPIQSAMRNRRCFLKSAAFGGLASYALSEEEGQ